MELSQNLFDVVLRGWKYTAREKQHFNIIAYGATSSPSWKVCFRKAVPQGINPAKLLMYLDVFSLSKLSPQVLTPFSEIYEEVLPVNDQSYESALVFLPGWPDQLVDFEDLGQVRADTPQGITFYQQSKEEAGGFVSLFLHARYRKQLVRGLTWYIIEDFMLVRHYGDLWVEVKHPGVSEIAGKIDECLSAAAVTATLSGIAQAVGGSGGGMPPGIASAFHAALVACLIAKGVKWAIELNIELYLRERS